MLEENRRLSIVNSESSLWKRMNDFVKMSKYQLDSLKNSLFHRIIFWHYLPALLIKKITRMAFSTITYYCCKCRKSNHWYYYIILLINFTCSKWPWIIDKCITLYLDVRLKKWPFSIQKNNVKLHHNLSV